MNDSPLRVVPPPKKEPERTPDQLRQQHTEAEWAELRRLLLGPEVELLRNVLERLNNPRVRAQELSRVLPEAIARINQAGPKNEETLTQAITPNFAQAFSATIKKNPHPVAEAITPLMGPAIRRAIALALNGFIQTVDFSVKHSLSWQGLQWRFEAWRTGQKFGDLALTRLAIYRVEHVFLIHKEKGLLLLHVAAPGIAAQEEGVIASMLTGMKEAVRSFGADSFGPSERPADTLPLDGDRTIWFEPGPYAVLAAVIYKQAPESLRTDYLAPAIEAIHLEQGEALAHFDGDTAPFEFARPHLESCLQSQYQGQLAEQAAGGFKAPVYLKAVAALTLIALVSAGAWVWLDARRWNNYISQLKATPGLVVVAEGRRGLGRFVEGLRDPLAADPARILREQTSLNPNRVAMRWEPYQALAPQFVLTRAQRLLAPPPDVKLQFVDGQLSAIGPATNSWIANARRLAPALGVAAFDESGLVNEDLRATEALRERIEARVLRFVAGSPRLMAGQEAEWQALLAELRKLPPLAARLERTPQIEIVGHTDTEGDEANNQRLSEERARSLLARLTKAKFNPDWFVLRGAASKELLRAEASAADKEFNRSVSFKLAWKN